jgi:hypothetical protein
MMDMPPIVVNGKHINAALVTIEKQAKREASWGPKVVQPGAWVTIDYDDGRRHAGPATEIRRVRLMADGIPGGIDMLIIDGFEPVGG